MKPERRSFYKNLIKEVINSNNGNINIDGKDYSLFQVASDQSLSTKFFNNLRNFYTKYNNIKNNNGKI